MPNVYVHVALGALFVVGVDYILAVNATDDYRAGRSHERNIRNGKRDRTAEHAENFGRDIGVHRQRGRDDRHVVKQALGEQRAYGAVDKPRRQNRLVAASALATLKAAGDFAYRIKLFLEIHAEREIVHTGTGRVRHRHVCHYDGVAAADYARAVGLSRVFARLDDNFSAADNGLENIAIHYIFKSPF